MTPGLRGKPNLLEDEVVRIARGRSKHDDDRNKPVLEETSERSVEGAVASPQPRPGEDTLATQLLHKATLGEDDTEDVSESRKRNEDGKCALSLGSKNIAEERRSHKALRSDDLVGRNGGEVGDVDKHV